MLMILMKQFATGLQATLEKIIILQEGQFFLMNQGSQINNFINQLPEENRNTIFFLQDRALPHNFRIVTNYLKVNLGERWIGTNDPVRWPSRYPNLTLLDFLI